MNYNSLTKEIAKARATIKYWANAISKTYCEELAAQIKEAAKKLKETLATLLRSIACPFERSEMLMIQREIETIEASI